MAITTMELKRTILEREKAIIALRARVARLEELAQRLLDNDPNEQICEGGITVLCSWRVDARRVLEEK